MTTGLTRIIRSYFTDAQPRYCSVDSIDRISASGDRQMACYLLWMLEELQTFTGTANAARRGRWIGYVQARLEDIGCLSNARNRTLTRLDVKKGSV